jgi:D-glycero-D-manno-heptose 1,7-bisphosphate phosphatase
MKEQKEILKSLNINRHWTLFLDRDGVINKKIENDYVRNWEQFKFNDGVIDGLSILRKIFGTIIIVTNQRGVGKGLMTEEDLIDIHEKMKSILKEKGIVIDGIYYCIHDYEKEHCNCRKPKIGLALKALTDMPFIDFNRSIVCGDSLSDIQFGKKLGAVTVYINEKQENNVVEKSLAELCFNSLLDFALAIKDVYFYEISVKE